jgi:hypothetical protein
MLQDKDGGWTQGPAKQKNGYSYIHKSESAVSQSRRPKIFILHVDGFPDFG